MSNKEKSRNIAVLGLFTAVIIVLQMLSYTIKIGQFNLSFVLVPIILAAVLYGPVTGGFMGLVFGVVTYICSVAGLDAGGNVLTSSAVYVPVSGSTIMKHIIPVSEGVTANGSQSD